MRALAIAIVAVGCGGNVVESAPVDGGGDSGFDIGDQGAYYEPIDCPSEHPITGSECNGVPKYECSYGDSPIPDCRTFYSCVAKPGDVPRWQPVENKCPDSAALCPAARPSEGAPCTTVTPSGCAFPDAALCFCVSDHGTKSWKCSVPPLECPGTIPNSGATCEREMTCSYGVNYFRCWYGATAHCRDGHWLWTKAGCAE